MLFGLFKRKKKTRYKFPRAIAGRCHGALNRAKEIARENGINVTESKGSVTVVTRDGERNNRNGWSWLQDGQQVMMTTSGGPIDHVITIATTPGDITTGWKDDALVHEMLHTIIERSYGMAEARHDGEQGRKLKGKVFGWH